ncbi:hypothetical protein ColLi_10978 [Colletotrichum liriopes]|uniref:Ferric oxidoreductase domain-containing protein n=1 Tax=Colletotrichum liriopes TaxID=708192 RepID=A0AA37GWT5_9PEZI|nr:hypothetical protein ColLi_10978 [Colletotrichum liriopes]
MAYYATVLAALTSVFIAFHLIGPLALKTGIAVKLSFSAIPFVSVSQLVIVSNVFVVFLALKNTPLGYLAACSYERLNVLHQVAGYVAMTLIIVHGATSRLRDHEEIYGIVSGFSFLIVVLAGTIVRLWYCELSYILHVSGFAISMVLAGLHQPELSKKIVITTAVGAGIWLFDRSIRLVRVVGYGLNNAATVHLFLAAAPV